MTLPALFAGLNNLCVNSTPSQIASRTGGRTINESRSQVEMDTGLDKTCACRRRLHTSSHPTPPKATKMASTVFLEKVVNSIRFLHHPGGRLKRTSRHFNYNLWDIERVHIIAADVGRAIEVHAPAGSVVVQYILVLDRSDACNARAGTE